MIWVATAYAALDMSATYHEVQWPDLILLPVYPVDEPIGLNSEAAELWRLLVESPVCDAELNDAQKKLVREFEYVGLASRDEKHRFRVTKVSKPWFTSPLHELVYGLIASTAHALDIDAVFIKGPILFRQNLRSRQHSGDVDVWLREPDIQRVADSLAEWGWTQQPGVWDGTAVNHSSTLDTSVWGCQIDLHHHFPGVGASEESAFTTLINHVDTYTFASVAAKVPRPYAHTVIQVLHLLRPSWGVTKTSREVDTAVDQLREAGAPAITVIQAWQAEPALQDVLRQLDPTIVGDKKEPVPANWAWRSEQTKVRGYITALRSLPWRQRPKVLWRIVWPTAAAAMLSDSLAGGRAKNPLHARVLRFRRALTWIWRR